MSDDQRSEEGDARRELHVQADRVFRGDEDEILIRVRQTRTGFKVFPYTDNRSNPSNET